MSDNNDEEKVTETIDWNNGGQWLIKSSYGPKGAGLYNPTDNIKRKQNRTSEELENVGQNKAVHEYTSNITGTSQQQADTEAKKMKRLNAKQPVKVFSPEEKAKLQAEYESKIKKSANMMSTTHHQQPTSEQWLAEAARQLGLPTSKEEVEKLAKQDEKKWGGFFSDFYTEVRKPISKTIESEWGIRGKIDQYDESKLSEEERRIRQIPVREDNN